MTTISIIVAADNQNGIGKENKLPWHISEDLKNFKKVTSGKSIIMGRKTWESLPFKPLPKRKNIVITSDKNYIAEGATVVTSPKKAVEACSENEEVFIIGGAKIYKHFFAVANKLYLTRLHDTFDTDTTLEGFDPSEWILRNEEHFEKSENHPSAFSFLVYEKRS
ncbi:MAG: dihydrofolate reductase [Salinivirgaceae bacterium]|nr:dihydrofolate reductase [Salinivirgaceae bacterium]MDY0279892.1 dihydrofolate reductase [Salinivirgaceae bacterium]